jgi:hypothetical protein
MTAFTIEQQEDHRKSFIQECRQKAWGAACNAHWIGKELEKLAAGYEGSNEKT